MFPFLSVSYERWTSHSLGAYSARATNRSQGIPGLEVVKTFDRRQRSHSNSLKTDRVIKYAKFPSDGSANETIYLPLCRAREELFDVGGNAYGASNGRY